MQTNMGTVKFNTVAVTELEFALGFLVFRVRGEMPLIVLIACIRKEEAYEVLKIVNSAVLIFVVATTTLQWHHSNTRPNLSLLFLKVYIGFSRHLTIKISPLEYLFQRQALEALRNKFLMTEFPAGEKKIWRWSLPEFLKSVPSNVSSSYSPAQFHHHLFYENTEPQRTYIICSNLCIQIFSGPNARLAPTDALSSMPSYQK